MCVEVIKEGNIRVTANNLLSVKFDFSLINNG